MSTDDLQTISGPTMGTRWTARLHPRAGTDMVEMQAALARTVARVDRQMSTWRMDSDLMRLNRARPGEWVDLPAELGRVLAAALEIGRQSGGVFDIGVGAITRAWGFGPSEGCAYPAKMRALIGVPVTTEGVLDLDPAGGRARKRSALDLDLSGIAKGFAADELARCLRGAGVTDFLVGIDGELVAAGHRTDAAPWAVAMEEPREGLRAARGLFQVTDRAIATSGDYRHVLHLAGARFSHTMDPRTGGPAQNRLASVTVLHDSCMAADAWATVLMVLGETAGPAFAAARGIEALFLIRDGETIREHLAGAAGDLVGAAHPCIPSPGIKSAGKRNRT